MICKGYGQANNELFKLYDPSKPKTWITGEDANNLYRHSKMQFVQIPDLFIQKKSIEAMFLKMIQ